MPGDSGLTPGLKSNVAGHSANSSSAKKRLKLYRSRSNTDSDILPQRMALISAAGDIGLLLESSNENSYGPHR